MACVLLSGLGGGKCGDGGGLPQPESEAGGARGFLWVPSPAFTLQMSTWSLLLFSYCCA